MVAGLKINATTVVLGLGLAAGAVWLVSRIVPKVAGEVGGLVTGDNFITRSAVNADGDRVTAYEGAGVVGTLGAATNAVSGGYLASWGQSLGGWVYDMTHDDYDPNAPANTGGASGSW